MSASSRKPADVEVTCCDGGPLLVRGAAVIRDDEGREHQVTRPVVALCRCGKSARRPWCDGTHKLVPRRPVRQ
ncbi:MAG: CDGSH iron-sulfur domain-containing protein [Nocardioidaceae bacterium]|nr:CDGSH iron-sulfur domain-containing protein [Nocardioidaceae bacterium]